MSRNDKTAQRENHECIYTHYNLVLIFVCICFKYLFYIYTFNCIPKCWRALRVCMNKKKKKFQVKGHELPAGYVSTKGI